ncbi:MAG: hypothetical protein KDD82_08510, partial [Planctomycetes bacterium]|nr:hypothetical protein [Planctomycetota bacterium]
MVGSRHSWGSLIAACAVAAANAQAPDSLPVRILERAERVDTVASAPTLTPELVALRELCAQGPGAIPELRRLVAEATPAGRVLALCGLEVLGAPECEALRAGLLTGEGEVLLATTASRAWRSLPLRDVVASPEPDAVRKPRGSPPARWGFSAGTPDVVGGGLPWATVLQAPPSDPSKLAGQSAAAWVERFALPNHLIRVETTDALVALGPAGVPPLAEAIGRPGGCWAASALRQLGYLAVPAIPALRRGLTAADRRTRLACAGTLSELGPFAVRALPELVARAEDPAELDAVRLSCAAICRRLRDWTGDDPAALDLEATRALVLRAHAHPDPRIQRAVELELDLAFEGLPYLEAAALACSRSATLRARARGVLERGGEAAAQALLPRARAGAPLPRGQAAVGLLSTPADPGEAWSALGEGLRDAELAPALLPGLLDLELEPPPDAAAALLRLACDDAPAAALAGALYLALARERQAPCDARLLELLRADGALGGRAAGLALRCGDA